MSFFKRLKNKFVKEEETTDKYKEGMKKQDKVLQAELMI